MGPILRYKETSRKIVTLLALKISWVTKWQKIGLLRTAKSSNEIKTFNAYRIEFHGPSKAITFLCLHCRVYIVLVWL